MALPFAFSNNTSPTGGQLDADLLALGAMGITSGTVTGTNALVFTQNNNQPTVSVYVNNQLFSFSAVANSTGGVTAAINGLSPLPVYLPSGAQAASGTMTSGTFYVIVYLAALNSAAGGFQIVSALPTANLVPVAGGSASGLLVKNDSSTPNTKIDITALTAVLVNSSGAPIYITSPSVVIDLTTVGANGMDVGARPTSGWVYNYLISTGAATAGLSTATSPTSGGPTLPVGYSYAYYAGAMYCDGSQNLRRSRQQAADAQYVVASATNTAAMPIIDSSAQRGSVSAPTWFAETITSFVPLTAGLIKGSLWNSAVGGGGTVQILAPNASYGASTSTTNPPLVSYSTITGNSAVGALYFEMVLETTTIQYANNTAGACGISCLGWRDYYVRA